MRRILYYLGIYKYAIIIGVIIVLRHSVPVLESSNPVLLVPLAVILFILISVVFYFIRITPRRKLYDETT